MADPAAGPGDLGKLAGLNSRPDLNGCRVEVQGTVPGADGLPRLAVRVLFGACAGSVLKVMAATLALDARGTGPAVDELEREMRALATTPALAAAAAGVAEEDEFEILTVASIVEFEGVPDIYDDVAGAIYNRLDNPDAGTGGLIQSDASVAYGLGETTVHISEEEKQDESNEYNTYANPGLPVGPIGSPSTEAIDAAANPAENDYYYWVTVNLDTGETKFASTLEEHAENVDEYQQWCSENEDKCQ